MFFLFFVTKHPTNLFSFILFSFVSITFPSILFPFLGGNAKLLVMLCVSPAQKFITETLQCIGFGSRARQVARGPAKKRRPTSFVPGSNSSLSIGNGNSNQNPLAQFKQRVAKAQTAYAVLKKWQSN